MNPEIELSFKRSKQRLAILQYINEYKTVYISQIARALFLDYSNVKGCLEGNTRYTKELSLFDLKLIKIIQNNHKYYAITNYGKEILKEVLQ